jgi:L-alanine-DL-glutamate epimerase-like enolase superfamily enzyme
MPPSAVRVSDRRDFLRRLAVGLPLATFLPASFQKLLAQAADDAAGRIIEAVEVLRITGPYDSIPGVNRQYNASPIHLYDERRPAPYRDNPNPEVRHGTMTQHYVRIRTRSGLAGLYGYTDPECVTPILEQVGRVLIGEDALAVEKLWDLMFRSNRHARAGHYMMAISQLDCALWDWRGRYFNAPVYQLLGGPTRNPVKAYGSALGFTVEPGKVGPRVAQLKAAGFDFQKWFFSTTPGSGTPGLNASIELAREAREAMGNDGEVMFDAYQGWDLQFARRWASAVAQYRPYFLEEPFFVADLESFKRLGRLTDIPIATGEHFYNRYEVEQYLVNDGCQIVQSDPEWCGGVTETLKMCALAASFGAKLIPHCHNIHAALHIVASQSPAVSPMAEYLINHVPGKVHFQVNPPTTDNGWIKLPTAPGFGIELDAAKITQTEVLTAK